MILARRSLPLGAAALLATPRISRAQDASPPILMVHGNSDHAALWLTTLWRFEANGWPRDVVLLDGREVTERREGVASIAVANLRLPAERVGTPIPGLFNEERVVGRPVPLAENRIALLEMSW